MKQFGNYNNIFIIEDEHKNHVEEEEKKEGKVLKKSQIEVKCFKWLGSFLKDKYADFFDYESNNFYLKDFKISSHGTIIDHFKIFQFKNEEVSYLQSSDLFNETHSFIQDNIVVTLLSIPINTQCEYVIHYNPHAFLVCKYLDKNNPLLSLVQNDIIRIGKYSLEVKHIQIKEKISNQKIFEVTGRSESICSDLKETDEDIVCRICFRGGKDNNIFVSPCNCKGSLKFYHPICLKQWIQSKFEIKYEYVNPFCYYIHLKNYKCEICKCCFPFTCITNTNEVVYLVDELEKKQSIMILKTMYSMNQNESNLCPYEDYVMLDFSNRYKKEISIGRGRMSMYQLNDISLSRNHCSLLLDNGEIRIKDCQSKFGTLLKMRKDILLSKANVTMTLQKGNSAYHFVYQII